MKNSDPIPSKYALKFLRWFCREEFLEEIEGDLTELYERRHEVCPDKAERGLWWDVIRSFRPVNIKELKINNVTMNALQNYTKVYFRRFRKETTHYLVNTLGLAMGFAVLFFILTYVHDELTIDADHSKSNRIYRVIEKRIGEDGQVQHFSATSNALAEAIKEEFPEIEESAKMIYLGSAGLEYNQRAFSDRNYALATSSIFKILDFDIVAGNPYKAFNGPIAVALNRTTARKLFGEEDPIGKVVTLPGKFENVEVIALYEDLTSSFSYQFNTVYITKFDQVEHGGGYLSSWDSRGMTTWVLFKENADPNEVLRKKDAFLEKYYQKEIRSHHDFLFQPITDIHLGSNHLEQWGSEPMLTIPYSRQQFVSIILLIGLFVMVIAALNFINLSSVQALKRTQEAGIRKVNGATVSQLRTQLFVETFLTLFIAYALSVCMLLVFHSAFLSLSNKSIPFQQLFSLELLSYHVTAFILVWIFSSLIPAVYYSRFSRSLILGKNVFTGKGDLLRKGFVTLQYGISMILIIGSIVLYRQLNYVSSKDLGFTNERLLTLDINSEAAQSHAKEIIHGLKANPNILNASISSRVPGEWKYIPSVYLSRNRDENPISATHYAADHHWLDTYGMELVQGSNFSGNDASDTLKMIINEKAVTELGLQNPIGQTLWVQEDTLSKMQIIGIVKDFHFMSLHEPIRPVIITSCNNPVFPIDYFTIKYNQNTSEAIAHIENVQEQFDPETPAEINFLDERWERYYQADQSRSNLILIATIISVIISTFGLFGLVNFTAERKTKEIGIRKVLGASVPNVIQIILKDYLILLLIALVLAIPVSWWVLSEWLADFAYRIELSMGIFSFAFAVVLFVSFATVIVRVYRLAKSNPVDSLRYE